MQATGRYQVSAPKCPRVLGVAIFDDSGSGGFAQNGDSVLVAAAAVGATSITILERRGFKIATAILGYGLPNQEDVAISSGATTGNGAHTVGALKFAHARGERIVEKLANVPLRPGSVTVRNLTGGTADVTTDDGQGNLVDLAGGLAAFSGTVDYNTGTIYMAYTGADCEAVYDADILVDTPDLYDPTGAGVFRNYTPLVYNHRDAPSYVHVSNLGDTEVGIYFERQKIGARAFAFKNSFAVALPAFGRAVLTCPSGAGYQAVRVRVGADNAGSSSLVDVDAGYIINDNGQ